MLIRLDMSTTINMDQPSWKIRRDSYNVMVAANNKLKTINYGMSRYAEQGRDVKTFLDSKKIYIESMNEYLKDQGQGHQLVDIDV